MLLHQSQLAAHQESNMNIFEGLQYKDLEWKPMDIQSENDIIAKGPALINQVDTHIKQSDAQYAMLEQYYQSLKK
jgi:hypothetical protein